MNKMVQRLRREQSELMKETQDFLAAEQKKTTLFGKPKPLSASAREKFRASMEQLETYRGMIKAIEDNDRLKLAIDELVADIALRNAPNWFFG
jgi:hypothetical protein